MSRCEESATVTFTPVGHHQGDRDVPMVQCSDCGEVLSAFYMALGGLAARHLEHQHGAKTVKYLPSGGDDTVTYHVMH